MGGTHGFAESEDAARMILCDEKVEPLANVVAFEKAVGGEWATAGAMGARVGEKYGEAVSEEELGVSGHAGAVIAETVEKDDGIAVAVVGMDGPGTEDDRIGSGDGNVCEIGVQFASDFTHGGFVCLRQRTAGGMQRAVGYEDSCHGGEC